MKYIKGAAHRFEGCIQKTGKQGVHEKNLQHQRCPADE